MKTRSTPLAARPFLGLAFGLLALWGTAHAATITEGVLELNLGSQNRFVYGTETQSVGTSGKCGLNTGSNLVSITTTGGTPGFNKQKEWFGVQESSNGVSCGRVSGSQSWSLALSGALAGKRVNETRLAVNAKKNVVITATTYVGPTITGTYVLKTGSSAPVGVEPGTNEAFCNPGVSDSNPDSNADCVWTFPDADKTNSDDPADWDKVTFTASVGEFGIGGPNTISQFVIGLQADGELGCPGGDNTFVQMGNGIVYQGTRLNNVDDPLGNDAPACVDVPYIVSTDCPTGVTGSCTNLVYDPLDQGSNMTFYFQWSWPPESLPGGGIDGIQRTVQFFLNGSPLELDICPELTWPANPYDTNNVFKGLADPMFLPSTTPDDQNGIATDGTQAGCLIRYQVIQDASGTQIQVLEEAWVQGDYAARRN